LENQANVWISGFKKPFFNLVLIPELLSLLWITSSDILGLISIQFWIWVWFVGLGIGFWNLECALLPICLLLVFFFDMISVSDLTSVFWTLLFSDGIFYSEISRFIFSDRNIRLAMKLLNYWINFRLESRRKTLILKNLIVSCNNSYYWYSWS
jgi:hypothetical protein